MKRRCKAFTLIEVLVVVAIIALLMGILLPSLGRARAQAKSVLCRARLRSLHQAMELYTNDHHGRMFGCGLNHNAGTFYCVLDPYVGEIDRISLCPVAERRTDAATTNDVLGTARQPWLWAAKALSCPAGKCKLAGCQEFGSYTLNGYLYNAAAPRILGGVEGSLPLHAGDPTLWYRSWHDVKTPANTPFLGDGIWVEAWPQADDTPPFAREHLATPHPSYNAGMLRFCLDRHGRAINMAFVDGHVDAVPLRDLWQLKWHRTFEVTAGITIP